jgi:hypothetical protein
MTKLIVVSFSFPIMPEDDMNNNNFMFQGIFKFCGLFRGTVIVSVYGASVVK